MMTGNTQNLLEDVVRHLNANVTHNNPYADDPTTTEKEMATIQKICAESFAKAEGTHSDISKLFAVVDLVLRGHCRSRTTEQELAPCQLKYSGIQEYLFYGHLLEISLMKENVIDSKLYYYYLSFSFPEQVHLYEVVEIPCDWVPEFAKETRLGINDAVVINFIVSRINEVIDRFCSEFVRKKKFRRREFSICGIIPVFSSPKKRAKKRKNKPGEASDDINEFQIPRNPMFTRLINFFETMQEKPTECARLFAVIHDLLLFNFSCHSSLEKTSWPGGAEYDGAAYEIRYSETQTAESDSLLFWHTFFLCVMTNGKEFYVCIRFAGDTSKKTIKKIVKALVPSFEAADSSRDHERIGNLSVWVSTIVNQFMKKVIAGSYHSQNPSYISSANDSESEG